MKKTIRVLVAILLSVSSFSAFADNDHYVIFVDAGSSGSRLHIFQYDPARPLSVKDIFSDSVSPGLSSFEQTPAAAGDSLKKLLTEAQTQLAGKTGAQTVPVNVFGTAGMRLVAEKNPKTEQTIYASVKQTLDSFPFFAKGNVQTIPGKMEGFYGWLDVNYLEGYFQNQQPTVGSIDMGGASTQIAYAVPASKNLTDDEVAVTINNQPYTVFSKSFLGLGQDESRASVIRELEGDACFPTGYAFDTFDTSRRGAFNHITCRNLYDGIIASHHVAQQILPAGEHQFIAYSGIFYTWQFFKVDTTPDAMWTQNTITDVCNQSWSDIQKAYPKEKEKYLSGYCANATYETELLHATYGLEGYQLTVLNQINGTGIDWTLGAALYSLVK
ncbi:MAG TPA: hypothetical protein VLJ15_02925 [Gammaproteobacteria bacterium]|nr:hypothetical protein [Gammaproteobacteria bacterium]